VDFSFPEPNLAHIPPAWLAEEAQIDEAAQQGEYEAAYRSYQKLLAQYIASLPELDEPDTEPEEVNDSRFFWSCRITEKLGWLQEQLQNDPDYQAKQLTPEQELAQIRDRIETECDEGNLDLAVRLYCHLAELYQELEQPEQAEMAYREAIMMARHLGLTERGSLVGPMMGLIRLLDSTPEVVALCDELLDHLEQFGETHSMMVADIKYPKAQALIKLAETANHITIEDVISVAADAIESQDMVCFHDQAHQIRQSLVTLLQARHSPQDAAYWENQIALFGVWEPEDLHSSKPIPGHIHLWEVYPDLDGLLLGPCLPNNQAF